MPTIEEIQRDAENYLRSEWYVHHGDKRASEVDPGPGFEAAMHLLQKVSLPDGQEGLGVLRRIYDTMAEHVEMLYMLDPYYHARVLAEIAHVLWRLTPMTVVDAGCGVGLPLGFFAYRQRGVQFQAYDLSPVSIDRALVRTDRLRLKNVRITCCDHASAADLLQTQSDAVIAINSILSTIRTAPQFPSNGDLGLWQWMKETDPFVIDVVQKFKAVAALLRPGGHLICFRQFNPHDVMLFNMMARQANLVEDEAFSQIFSSDARTNVRVRLAVYQKR